MSAAEIAEITNLINLYPIAVDTQRWALFDRVFTQQVHADFGGPAVWDGLEPLKQAFAMIHAPFASTQHSTRGHHVALGDGTAQCLSYVHGRFLRHVEGGSMFESCGWYDDDLVRTDAGWRIARRVCRSLWWGGNAAVLETAPGVKVDPVLDTLRGEAEAGRLRLLDALAAQGA